MKIYLDGEKIPMELVWLFVVGLVEAFIDNIRETQNVREEHVLQGVDVYTVTQRHWAMPSSYENVRSHSKIALRSGEIEVITGGKERSFIECLFDGRSLLCFSFPDKLKGGSDVITGILEVRSGIPLPPDPDEIRLYAMRRLEVDSIREVY
jgi:hypothetical protein